MAHKKSFKIPGVTFSAKRALGITKAKQKFARATGIPTTKAGRQRKVGRAITGGGCLVYAIGVLLLIGLIFLVAGCEDVPAEKSLSSSAALSVWEPPPSSESSASEPINESVSESEKSSEAESSAEPESSNVSESEPSVSEPSSEPISAPEASEDRASVSDPESIAQPAVENPPASSQSKQPESQGPTVYYTKSGSKYHYENPCGNGTYYPCTLEEALAKGLGPCNKCVLH